MAGKENHLTVDRVRDIVLSQVSEQDLENKAFYVDEVIHPKGSELTVGRNKYEMASDTIVVFVDEEPGKNWAHKCRYLFFDVQSGDVEEVRERFPPSLTEFPGTFRPLAPAVGARKNSEVRRSN